MRFIVFGDSKGKENGINTKIIKSLMNQSINLDPEVEFVVVCGDSVAGSINKEIMKNQLNSFKNIISTYYPGKILVPVVGNHDINAKLQDESYEKIFDDVYFDLKPSNTLEGYNRTVYYMDFKDTRLIVLNSFHPGEVHKITGKQLTWFEKASSDDIKNKIVIVHSPAFPTGAHLGHCLDMYPEFRDKFWNVIDKNNISLVFSSHEHNYSRRLISMRNNIYQIITGGGGETLRDKYKDKKGVIIPPIATYHFVIVDIEYEHIKVCSISSNGKKLDEFTI